MRSLHAEKLLTAALALALAGAACQPGATNTNATNVNAANANSTNTSAALNANNATASATAFETRRATKKSTWVHKSYLKKE